ncbi:MAG TPA: hypothetical protein VJ623_13105 [Holophagaceae bacterium]|nr:hypothetical protein [Holophagaceae bacterium]
MDLRPAWLAHLETLASAESVRREDLGPGGLEELLALGFIRTDERPKQASLESRYEDLQDTHRRILAARNCADRLQRRLAPRFRFVDLLPALAPPRPGAEDPDVIQLAHLLEQLDIQVRGAREPEHLMAHLDRVMEYLQVEGRECLDRMADTDRELDVLQRQAPPRTLVEPGGFFTLTPAGEAALPEGPVLEAFDVALQSAFGPMTHRGSSASHFREDPASFIAYLLEGMARGARPSALISEYESLLEAFERLPAFSDIRALRAKVGLLIRLLRGCREEPKRAYLWCNRDRLNALAARIRALAPNSLAGSGWHLPYAVDLFLAEGNFTGDEAEMDQRTRLFETVRAIQTELLQEVRITDGQSLRLTLAVLHAARTRKFTPGILLDRFVRQSFEVMSEAMNVAPYDLGDRGTRLIFGAHLTHAAGYTRPRLRSAMEAFGTLQERLREEGPGVPTTQSTLHAFATLDRLERQGTPLPLEAYLGIRARIHRRLSHHKLLSRAFRTDQVLTGDEAALLSNLCARVCFQGLSIPPEAKYHPDAGAAGLYEIRTPGHPPLLGSPFGTLMLL